MNVCTFFGHRDAPSEIQPFLISALEDIINVEKVTTFYVGNEGNFDRLSLASLLLLKKKYPDIKFTVVLAYLPKHTDAMHNDTFYANTILPEEVSSSPPKFKISKRNIWMINKSKYVITYVSYNTGGAAKYAEMAKKKGCRVINLAKAKNRPTMA